MPSIALVVLDTLRADAFAEQFDWLPGTRFTNAWSTSHWTGAAHASLFTGRYPSEAGVTVKGWSLPPDLPTLAGRLADAGYATRAFSANINVSPHYGYDRGFDRFEGSWRLDLPDDDVFNWLRYMEENDAPTPLAYLRGLRESLAGDYDRAASLAAGARHWLRRHDLFLTDEGASRFRDRVRAAEFGEPTFLFANLMEAHQPYSVPRAYRTTAPCRLGPAFEATFRERFDDPAAALAEGVSPADVAFEPPDADHARRAYGDCVRYLADVYRDAFEALSDAFDYVFTLSDHGELFGEHGAWEHGYGLYPELTQVPLVVSGPGFPTATREEPVSLLDVHRTVLALAGAGGDARGHDLRDLPADRAYLTEYHGVADMRRATLLERGYDPDAIDAVDEPYRGIVLPDDYYGYESDAGWRESGTPPGEPRERLAVLRERVPTREPSGDDVDEAVRARLEDLGYA